MSERGSVEKTLQRIATIWGLLWLVTITLNLISNANVVRLPALAWTALALEALALVLLFRLGARLVNLVIFVAVAAAFINALNVDQLTGPPAQLLTTTWLNAACLVVAFIAPSHKLAQKVLVVAAGISGVLLVVNSSPYTNSDHAKHFVILPIIYSAAIGLAALQAAKSMRVATSDYLVQSQAFAAAHSREAQAEAQGNEARLLARVLHDTVINTLGAIHKGISPSLTQAAQQRCADNLRDLHNFMTAEKEAATGTVKKLLDAVSQEASVRGLQLKINSHLESDMEISQPALSTCMFAIRELLTNVVKHSRVNVAEVTLSSSDSQLCVSVCDSGIGWKNLETDQLRGLAGSVMEPIQSLGGQVTFTSSTNVRNEVSFTVPLQSGNVIHPIGQEEANIGSGSALSVARLTGLPLLILSLTEALLFINRESVFGNLVALAILVGAVCYLHSKRSQVMNFAATAIFTCAIACVIALPMLANGICRSDVAESWGTDGAAVLLIIVGMLGPRLWSALLSMVSVSLGLLLPLAFTPDNAGCLSGAITVLPIEIGTVLAIFAFRTHLSRLWKATAKKREQLLFLERHLAIARATTSVRNKRLNDVVQALEPFLLSASNGELNLQSSEVQTRAGEGEEALRSLLLLDYRLAELGNLISWFVAEAFHRHIVIRVVSGEFIADPNQHVLSQLREALAGILAHVPAHGIIRIGLFSRGESKVLTLVFSRISSSLLSATFEHSQIMVTVQESEDEMLVEMSWRN